MATPRRLQVFKRRRHANRSSPPTSRCDTSLIDERRSRCSMASRRRHLHDSSMMNSGRPMWRSVAAAHRSLQLPTTTTTTATATATTNTGRHRREMRPKTSRRSAPHRQDEYDQPSGRSDANSIDVGVDIAGVGRSPGVCVCVTLIRNRHNRVSGFFGLKTAVTDSLRFIATKATHTHTHTHTPQKLFVGYYKSRSSSIPVKISDLGRPINRHQPKSISFFIEFPL